MQVLCLNISSRPELFSKAYLEPSQTSMMEYFCKKSERILVIDYFRKKVSL